MYNRISYGSFSPYLSPMPDISRKEFNLLIALLLPTVIFGIFPSVIIETLDIPTTTLLYVTETPNFSLNNYLYIECFYLQETSVLQQCQVDELISKLANIKITRSFIKRGIMTIAYGVTVKGICEQLFSGANKQFTRVDDIKILYSLIDSEFGDTNLVFTYKEIFKLSEIIHDVLFDSYPSLKKLVKYLNEIASFIQNLGMNIPVI